ncbi:restriction endonuclease subunit S [Bacillus haynesii]|uniref:restriction endonuclease subunit S n=1 Tax=Bacillus haynesii TaxID=1925021 RepID=UPI00227EBB7B|nr:restriction endonuclease subunit S [Bacillus haynesii]MCY8007693.1 restriction endonuclease subunit S [Bacillus haynesii]
MNAQDLKNSILKLAIQGKLVGQREEEGTAEELYQLIQEEKKMMVEEGKIKKSNKFPEITEEEILFDIPESWKWVRFGDVMINRDSERIPLSVSQRESLEKVYDYYGASGVIDKVDKYIFDEKLMLIGEDGANLLTRSKPIAFIAEGKYWVNNHAHVIDCGEYVYLKYVMYYINAISLAKYVTGTAQPKMNQTKLNSIPVPLPPLEEQKRIVAKIEELMPYVEKYDKAYTEVVELNKRFPEDMQKSTLQYAIQGKLVEQREEEGTAEELYQQIQEEKKKLVEEGKVKKPKKSLEITGDEIPYDIPENWKWVRLGDIFEINPRNTVNDDTTVSFIPMALIEDGYRSEFSYEIKSWGEIKKGYTHFRDGDIVMAKITPCFQNLKSAIMLNLENGVGAGTTELHVLRAYNDICLDFFLWFIKSPIFVSTCVANMTGTAGQQRVGTDIITNYVVPLPPLEEQKRIVVKIEEMLHQCKKLVK